VIVKLKYFVSYICVMKKIDINELKEDEKLVAGFCRYVRRSIPQIAVQIEKCYSTAQQKLLIMQAKGIICKNGRGFYITSKRVRFNDPKVKE
jgi:hypothetical protein